jgi:hypothetical protein
MKSKSNGRSVQRVLAMAAVIAVLGVSLGVPVEPALAAQVWAAQVVRVPRARPLELAATAIERVGQKRGTADGSKQGARQGGGGKRGIITGLKPGSGGKRGIITGLKRRGAKRGVIITGLKPGEHPGGVNRGSTLTKDLGRGQAPGARLPAVQTTR